MNSYTNNSIFTQWIIVSNKRTKFLIHANKWINLKIILSERSQTQECILISIGFAAAGKGGQLTGKGLREISLVMEMFSILTDCSYMSENTSSN